MRHSRLPRWTRWSPSTFLADGSTIRPRSARLVLFTPDGAVVGALPPVSVEFPWWAETVSVVEAVRERHGVEAVVLRLLEAENPQQPGGLVTYLAEVAGPAPVDPWPGELRDHRLRASYAKPGGPAKDLAWARDVLRAKGIESAGLPVQVKTWNLSSLWRIPTSTGDVWLKAVPPFFAHEGAMLEALQGEPVPVLLARDHGRSLIAAIPGEDRFEASEAQYLQMVSMLVALQAKWIGRGDELMALGLPDWRPAALIAKIADVVARTGIGSDDRATLTALVDDLPDRFRAITACGLPDTLVHGDFHSGNVRGDGGQLTILDWGDSGIGHPLLDQPAFLERMPASIAPVVNDRWIEEWRRAVPGCDPARASVLLAPIAAARQAVIYRMFLDNIEPSEHVYHASDPHLWLVRTAELARER